MKIKTSTGLIILSIFLLHTACSPYRYIDRHAKRKLTKANLSYRKLTTEDYDFTYWDNKSLDKPVYVLLHGFGSSTHLQWYKQVKVLSKKYRLILPNLLYHGSNPKVEQQYSIRQQVEAMKTLLKELSIDSMILGGISYGGLVAAEMAKAEVGTIEQLTIFSSPVKYFTEADLNTVQQKANVNHISELLVPADEEMMQKLTSIVLYKDRNIPKFIARDLQENLFGKEQQGFNKKQLLINLTDNQEAFQKRDYAFNCPVLLIWGEDDELIPSRIGKQLNEHIPQSELVLIPKAGHAVNVEQTKAFNDALLKFLNKN